MSTTLWPSICPIKRSCGLPGIRVPVKNETALALEAPRSLVRVVGEACMVWGGEQQGKEYKGESYLSVG